MTFIVCAYNASLLKLVKSLTLLYAALFFNVWTSDVMSFTFCSYTFLMLPINAIISSFCSFSTCICFSINSKSLRCSGVRFAPLGSADSNIFFNDLRLSYMAFMIDSCSRTLACTDCIAFVANLEPISSCNCINSSTNTPMRVCCCANCCSNVANSSSLRTV